MRAMLGRSRTYFVWMTLALAVPSAEAFPGLPAPPSKETAPATAPAAAPPQPEAPAPIAEADVPRAATAAETRIRALRSLASRTYETEEIAAASRSVLDSVEALKGWMQTREPAQQTARALRSIGQEWRLDADLLGGWMEATGHRLDALGA